ncbi:MAG: acyl-CoA desaturase [Polyangiales bacterium]
MSVEAHGPVETGEHVEKDHSIHWVKSIPFFAVHALAIYGVIKLGWSWKGFGLAIALYYFRMFFVTAGYHRYFSHRSFRTSRVFAFILGFFAETTAQKGIFWWAGHHRQHHRYSDQPGDVHSALRFGFLWSHVGWILSRGYEDSDESRIKDLTKFPELRLLDRYWWAPPWMLGIGLFLVGGWWALVWGLFVSTTILWHGTFTINSLTHMFGHRRYKTTDNSKNSAILAFITMGEGWHNNHHYYQRSVRQGFFWWEFDFTYYILKALSLFGIVWDLHAPPKHVVEGNRIDDEPRESTPVRST